VLGGFFENLYLKVFVNIIVGNSKSTVYIELCKEERVLNSDQEVFVTTTINAEMQEFIYSYINETPYYYISVLDTSETQGAVALCEKSQLASFFEVASSKYICNDKKWTYYTSKTELALLKNSYAKVGVDFIFSPFILLSDFFKDKIAMHVAMFVLIQEDSLSLSVFDNSELLFAKHLSMENYSEGDILSIDEGDDIDLDLTQDEELTDIEDLDEIESLDDFGDIEDLDSIDEIDEFSESKDLEEELSENSEESFPQQESEGFNEDYQRFLLIHGAISSFYKDKRYKSAFIETAYIADSVGVSGDLKRYLEEEMFLSTYIRHVDLTTELCEIAKREIG